MPMRRIMGWALAALLITGCANTPRDTDAPPEAPPPAPGGRQADITALQRAIQGACNELVAQMERTATEVAESGLVGEQANRALAECYARFRIAFSVVAIDRDNRLTAVAPESFANAVGKQTGDPEGTDRVISGGKPVLSKPFLLAEGFHACALGVPVRREQAGIVGQVSVTFNPADLIDEAAPAALKGLFFVIRASDSVMVYSNRPENVGRPVLSDPKFSRRYPSLVELVQRAVKEPEGEGVYTYVRQADARIVAKQCLWRTVACGGREWRVILFWEP